MPDFKGSPYAMYLGGCWLKPTKQSKREQNSKWVIEKVKDSIYLVHERSKHENFFLRDKKEKEKKNHAQKNACVHIWSTSNIHEMHIEGNLQPPYQSYADFY